MFDPIQADYEAAVLMNRGSFSGASRLAAGGVFATAFLAPRIGGAGIGDRCTTRERFHAGLSQKG